MNCYYVAPGWYVLLKGLYAVYKAVWVFIAHVIFLGPKKITSFIVDVIDAHDKE